MGAAAQDTSTETVAVSARGSRTLVTALLMLLVGGGAGVGVVAGSRMDQAKAAPPAQCVSPAEAAEAEKRSAAHAVAAAAAVRDDCRRELATAMGFQTEAIARFEKRLDELGSKLDGLRDDVVALKVSRGRR